jgi:hypothetical protein
MQGDRVTEVDLDHRYPRNLHRGLPARSETRSIVGGRQASLRPLAPPMGVVVRCTLDL